MLGDGTKQCSGLQGEREEQSVDSLKECIRKMSFCLNPAMMVEGHSRHIHSVSKSVKRFYLEIKRNDLKRVTMKFLGTKVPRTLG